MRLSGKLAAVTIKLILSMLCRVDSKALKNVPKQGPAIIIMNHINFLEVPLIYTFLRPRPVYGIVKKETWNNKFIGWLGTIWEAVPLDREGKVMESFKRIKEILDNKNMIIIAPEGTRTKNGKLIQGHPGLIPMALHSDATIIPVGHYGGQHFWKNFKSLKRTKFHIAVGKPFKLRHNIHLNKDSRRQIIDEIMLQLAKLLPLEMHGYYEGKSESTDFLEFISEQI